MSQKAANGLDLLSQRIVNVGTPTATTDATTKSYVDNATVVTIGPAGSAATIDVSLGTIFLVVLSAASCAITLSGAPASGFSKPVWVIYRQAASPPTGGNLVTHVTTVMWPNGIDPTAGLSSAANKEDMVTYVPLGGTWRGAPGAFGW